MDAYMHISQQVGVWLHDNCQQKVMSSTSLLLLPPSRTHADTQTNLLSQHATIWVSGCRVCLPDPVPEMENDSKPACGMCTHVDE